MKKTNECIAILVLQQLSIKVSLSSSFSKCDRDYCSCCAGHLEGGGKDLNDLGLCEYYCGRDTVGNYFCGDGPDYLTGIDCRNCRTNKGNIGNVKFVSFLVHTNIHKKDKINLINYVVF